MAFTLAAMGSYVVGGRRVEITGAVPVEIALSRDFHPTVDPNGHYWVESAYVQYFVPAARNGLPPVLLVHGGGLTGSCWETTPDGRPGWLQRLLEAGCEVHVIDNVERGRAGFSPLPGVWPDRPLLRTEEESWTLFRFGTAAGYDRRVPFAGQQFPVERLDVLARRSVPRWLSTTAAQIAALTAAVERFDDVILIGHSQGGGHAATVAGRHRHRVAAVVAIEPHGAETPPPPTKLPPLLIVEGDFLDRDATWRKLSARWREASAGWANAGGLSDVLRLPELGQSGNSHLPMMDRNSDVVLNYLIDWLRR